MKANGIDFVIGGKDKAAPAMQSVEKSLARLEQKADSLATTTGRLAAITGVLASAYGSIKSLTAAVGGISAINSAYDAQIESVRQLTAALKIRGDVDGRVSAQLQQTAKQMQAVTGVSDNVTMSLMQQASLAGVIPSKLDEVAKAAIGLADATGKDLHTALGDITQALKGNFDAFAGIKPEILYMRSNEEKLAAVLKIAKQGYEDKASSLNVAQAASERLSVATTTLTESAGALIAPLRVLAYSVLEQLAVSMVDVVAPAVQWSTQLLDNMGPAIEWLQRKTVEAVNLMIGAFTMLEVIVTNLDQVWQLMVAQAELRAVQMASVLQNVLLVKIPAYAKWFSENFFAIIRDGLVAAYTVVTHLVRNIIDAFAALWKYIASGGTSDILGELGEIAGRSYLEGFQATVAALPETAGRVISEREKSLLERIGQIGANLGDQFSEKFSQRMLKVGDTISEAVEEGVKKTDNNLKLKVMPTMMATQGVQATQTRLLTRGAAASQNQQMIELLKRQLQISQEGTRASAVTASATSTVAEETKKVAANTSNTVLMVPTL